MSVCSPMDCGMPGFPLLHCLLEFAQNHIHWISHAIQPSHPLLPLLLLSSVFLSIRVFSNESVLWIRWPKDWGFGFSISPSSEYSGLISSRIDWFDFLALQGTLKSLQWFIYLYIYIYMKKAMAPHSSTLAWEIPGMEEPGGLQSMGSQKSWTWLSN